MTALIENINTINLDVLRNKHTIMSEILYEAVDLGYTVVDIDMQKPWGGFVRFDTANAKDFIDNYFPSVDSSALTLGRDDVELSPKFLLVHPSSRLSWQRHDRRAEMWSYISGGGYHRGDDPEDQGDLHMATPGEVVQFAAGECHRLVGTSEATYTLVAEIWQHTDHNNLSDEDDITRLQDDYRR